MVKAPVGIYRHIWDAMQIQAPRVVLAEAAIDAMPSLAAEGRGHQQPLQAALVKMIDEYALHAGQAHMLRFAALGKIVR